MPRSSPESLLQLLQCFLKHPNQIKQIHSRLITNGHLLHNQNPKPSASKWMSTLLYNTLIRAHLGFGQPCKTLLLFIHMLDNQAPPNSHTFPPLIKAAAATSSSSLSPRLGSPLHTQVVKRGVLRDPFIQTSFVSFYAELGKLCDARKVFEEMSEPCVVAWNAMIDGFGKNGDMGSAVLLFESMPERDVVSWTSVINGFGRNGCFSEGMRFFQMMMNRENVMGCLVMPNEATYVSVLSSCANLGGWGSIYWGKQIHGHGSESGLIEALALGQTPVSSTPMMTSQAEGKFLAPPLVIITCFSQITISSSNASFSFRFLSSINEGKSILHTSFKFQVSLRSHRGSSFSR